MAERPDPIDCGAALVAELAAAIAAVADGGATSAPAAVEAGPGWRLSLAATGAHPGTFDVWVDRAGASRLAALVLGDESPEDSATADLLREMWSQAASALCLKAPYSGMKLAVTGPVPSEPVHLDGVGFAVDLAGRGTVHLDVKGAFDAPRAAAPASGASSVHVGNLEVVLDIELPLVVRFGRTVMSLKALTAIGPGSIVDMGRSPDDLVELLVSDRVIARGEVVIVGGNYGVRITDLVSRADRARAVEV